MEIEILNSHFNFDLLDSNFSFWIYKEVKKDDSLIVLRELELTATFAAFTAAATYAAFAAFAADLTAHAAHRAGCAACAADGIDDYTNYLKIRNQVKKEFEKTKKIEGFEVLNLRSLDKLWISHYDMKALEKQNKENYALHKS